MSPPVSPLPAADLAHVLEHTRSGWATVRGASLFITGGTGFFGLWLLETLAHANDTLGLGLRAVVLTRDPAAFARKAPHLARRGDLEFVRGDIRDFAFPAGRFSHVVHAATEAVVPAPGTDPCVVRDVIVEGTRRALHFARQAGVRRFLFVSSGAVYGPQPPELEQLPEDYVSGPEPLTLANAYGIGKRMAEELCLAEMQAGGPECLLARCFAFVGPHLPLDRHFAIGNFIRDALRGGPVRVNGDGTPIRSYLYAADLAAWLWTILFQGRPGRAYNVGSDEAYSIAEIATAVQAELAPGQAVEISRAALPGQMRQRYLPSVRRAREELGLVPWTGLRNAIARTADWTNHPRHAA